MLNLHTDRDTLNIKRILIDSYSSSLQYHILINVCTLYIYQGFNLIIYRNLGRSYVLYLRIYIYIYQKKKHYLYTRKSKIIRNVNLSKGRTYSAIRFTFKPIRLKQYSTKRSYIHSKLVSYVEVQFQSCEFKLRSTYIQMLSTTAKIKKE